MLKTQKPNDLDRRGNAPALKKVRKSVYKQALLAGLMIVLTVVVIFAVTAAWYTNIAQTNGLVFKVSEWGFQGTITLGSDPITAAPGSDGVLELTAVSNSNEPTAVGISIDKSGMMSAQYGADMSQRIYFYVDGAETRNGEIMDRVYLNSMSSYTYTMFSQGSLILTEEYHNDALLKWQWVRDVLGYYVLGTWDGSTMTMTVEEYLRPIEYDYDAGSTTFDIDGTLMTIDGTTTVAEFLYDVSLHDGYPGTITHPGDRNAGGYYPVVDMGNGYGIYAYLCSKSEIQSNNVMDTDLGIAAGNGVLNATWPVQVTISAQNIENAAAEEIATADELVSAVEAAAGESVMLRLTNNVTLTNTLELDQLQDVYIDLNGKTLNVTHGTYSSQTPGISAQPGSSLTLVNGDLSGNGSNGIAIYASGAEVTLSGVDVLNTGCALYVRDDGNSLSADSLIRIVNSTIVGSEEGIYLSGNGSQSAQKTQLVVENSSISSGYIGIMGNGNDTQWGTDIQIINSTINGYYAGIYQPQRSSTLVVTGSGSVITGKTGIVLKGGSASIQGGTVSGTLETAVEPKEYATSGFNDTGDAIYIETNYGYPIDLEISNATLTSAGGGQAVRVYQTAANVTVKIYGGTFCSDVSGYVPEGYTCREYNGSWIVTNDSEDGNAVAIELEDFEDYDTTVNADAGGEDATTGGEDTTTGGEDATTGGEDATTGDEKITTGDEEITTGGEDATNTDENGDAGGSTETETGTDANTETETGEEAADPAN